MAKCYIIQTYNIMNGLESIDWYSGLQFVLNSCTKAAMSYVCKC